MVFRSTRGARIAPRYRVAMLAYSDHVYDLLDGVKAVDHVVRYGIPELAPMSGTATGLAFRQAERLLARELANDFHGPAPLICHMTDGHFTGNDPEPIAKRIMSMATDDGAVLIENIFMSDEILPLAAGSLSSWPGISPGSSLPDDYGEKLKAMSSTLPESYRMIVNDAGYNLTPGALMLLPGSSAELVELGFAMSAATPIARSG
jgi:hypothetical protein